MNDINKRIEELSNIFDLIDNQEPHDIVLICRQVLEKAIDLIFFYKEVQRPKNAQLLELINNEHIQNFFGSDVIIDSLHFIRIVGINALHGKQIKKSQSKVAYNNTEYLIEIIKDKIVHIKEISEVSDEEITEKLKMNEENTRKIYIDLYLNESGWEVVPAKGKTKVNDTYITSGSVIPGKACCEIPVEGMNNKSGIGFCDYVLYGKDGKPLAVVEAKKTSESPEKGQQQVREYGKALKKKYEYIPVLYYTNGYSIFVVDGKYPPRKVAAFHTLKELELLIQRRDIKRITDISINDNITDRPYQKVAITKICERFNDMQRRALLVMATGTGKTRVAISIVDVLLRNNWIKNVLFLADRTSLVRQAFKNFDKLLPNMSFNVLSDPKLANTPEARITFSTHQTMINYIDSENKEFSIGRFDLIIIDEAHRSIFNKYGSIFSYFDSLLIGLTATPKEEVDANTYSIFNCESGIPNFSYSLQDGVNEKYLVPYKVVNKTTKLIKEGIKYSDLSQEDKNKVDTIIDDDIEDDDILPNSMLFRKIYNEGTCKIVLEDLMNQGLKVNQGQLLGKTIIFAYNHNHAQLIVDTFYKMYPRYLDYCKLIDNYVKNSEQLIEEFKTDDNFRIAVSVDMLDTGVDIPEILNLVFFKKVRSKIKFIQMIGRGTRLCANLMDYGDKDKFLIFDYLSNFEYFGENFDGENREATKSLTQQLFEIRLSIMCELQKSEHQLDSFKKQYYKKLNSQLFETIKSIKDNSTRISVRNKMKYVDIYSDLDKWKYISPLDKKEIIYHLLNLIDSEINEDYFSYAFDKKVLLVELCILENGSIDKAISHVNKIRLICQYLLGMASIKEIYKKIPILEEVVCEETWKDVNIEKLEYYRINLRNLMKYVRVYIIDPPYPILIDVDDESEELDGNIPESLDIRTYETKVMDYLLENSNNPTILKIKNLEKLNSYDFDLLEDILWVQLGTKEDYYKITKIENLAVFIRSLVGIEQEAINEKFGTYIKEHNLSGEQLEFINAIINYVRENGDIEAKNIINEPPFNNVNLIRLFGNSAPILNIVIDTIHDSVSA